MHDIGCHVAWCPKYRRRVLEGAVRGHGGELIRRNATGRDEEIVALEFMLGHVHLFLRAHRLTLLRCAANQFKGFTCWIARSEFPRLRSRLPALWSLSLFVAPAGREHKT
jgi:putative transposase